MYPYDSWFQWLIRPRQKHLVDGLEDREDAAFKGPDGEALRKRLNAIEGWLKVRAVLIVLLSFSAVAAVASWVFDMVNGVALQPEIASLVERIRNITTTASGVLTLLYLFTLRTLGQLEIDAILLMPAHRAHWHDDTGTPASAKGIAVTHSGSMTEGPVPRRVHHRAPTLQKGSGHPARAR